MERGPLVRFLIKRRTGGPRSIRLSQVRPFSQNFHSSKVLSCDTLIVMNNNHFTFGHYLAYWSKHAFFCATPSFVMAIMFGYSHTSQIIAMLLAIATFIAFYAAVSNSRINNENRLWIGKHIHLAAVIRSIVSGIGLLGLTLSMHWKSAFTLAIPDFYAGLLATVGYKWIFDSLIDICPVVGAHEYYTEKCSLFNMFFETYVTTLIEGAILSITLLLLTLLITFFSKFFFKRPRKPLRSPTN